MHEDDEERFPRITLWQFLAGILKTMIRFAMWPAYRWNDLQSSLSEKKAKKRVGEPGRTQAVDSQDTP
ncbi:hypothetical protein ILT44_27710 [Microvirga sp. BT689]|uniref:hypothetical protein n=1 Tax=Microvirga arvi TaxID=2778731 RepID=UPI0019524665|nr:hypothetical protein [Microvirga arvi]MBM6583991.1 hypothetical protein [Microvirga arvi]